MTDSFVSVIFILTDTLVSVNTFFVSIKDTIISVQIHHNMLEWEHGGDEMTIGQNIRTIRKKKGISQKKTI